MKLPLRAILQDQRKLNKFCDVTFRIGDGLVYAHRCVLAGASECFDRMFSSGFKETDNYEVDMSSVFSSTGPLNLIIDYIYGMDVTLSEDYIIEIINASKLFMLDELKEECVSFLFQNITIMNSLSFWSLADKLELKDLNQKCSNIVTSRFHDVIQHLDEVLLVSPEELVRMFKAGCGQHCNDEDWNAFLRRWMLAGGTEEHKKTEEKLRKGKYKENDGSDGIEEEKSGSGEGTSPRRFSDLTKLTDYCTVIPSCDAQQEFQCEQITVRTVEGAPNTVSEESLVAEMPSGVSEEVLVCTANDMCTVYRPRFNKWLCVTENNAHEDIILGVGKRGMSLFKTNYRTKKSFLQHIKEEGEIQIPAQNIDSEEIYFSVRGLLFCCQYTYMEKERGLLKLLKGPLTFLVTLSVYMYVTREDKWKYVCAYSSSELSHARKSRPYVVHNNFDHVFILTKHDGSLYKFSLEHRYLIKVSTVPPELPYGVSPFGGRVSKDDVVFYYVGKDLVYTFSSQSWSVRSHVAPVNSQEKHVVKVCYMDTFGVEIFSETGREKNGPFFHCLSAYRKEDNLLYTIPPPPTCSVDCNVTSQIVLSAFLDELKEKVCGVNIDSSLTNSTSIVEADQDDSGESSDPENSGEDLDSDDEEGFEDYADFVRFVEEEFAD